MPSTREVFSRLKQRVNRGTRAKKSGRSYEEQNEYEYNKAENERRRAGGNPVTWREKQQKQFKKDKASAKATSDKMQKEYKDYSDAPAPWKNSSEKKKASWKPVKDKLNEMALPPKRLAGFKLGNFEFELAQDRKEKKGAGVRVDVSKG